MRGRIAVAGRLIEPVARLRAIVEHPSRKPEAVEFTVRAAQAPGALAARVWARMRMEELEAEHELNRAEIRRLGRAFRLVTRETSLIVLDRVEDYARHEIAPPPELRAEYERLTRLAAQRRTADRRSHLEQVVRRFEEKAAWWNREFPKGDRPAQLAKSAPGVAGALLGDALRGSAEQRAAPAMAASAPAARPAPAQRVAPAASVAALKESDDAQQATGVTIQLQRWQPDAPHAARLRNAAPDALYRVYLDERPSHLNSTAFFLDAADVFFDRGQTEFALRVLSNLAEMDLESRHILRVLGQRLVQAGQAKLAIPVFRKVAELSPEEPQSWRDLGLAYATDRQFQKAIDTLYEVVIRPWHGRFPEVELIALAELNAIVATAGEPLDTGRIDSRLLKNLPLDLRVVLTWDADNSDIDLWVTDPSGEKAFYGNRFTYQGGRMSLDFTGGYGPEEFSLKRAKPGKYRVDAQYFGDRRQMLAGPVTLHVKLTTKFGLPEQREQAVTLRLKDRSESVFVAEFEVTE
jgi:tetratricopeptide (TPR) repeat protein